MKLATIRTAGVTRAVWLDGDVLVDLGHADLGTLLAEANWGEVAKVSADSGAATYPLEGADFAPVVPNPSKVICVGHNYSNHIKEMGRDLPEYPTLFPTFADSLIGANDPFRKPAESDAIDWEVELVVVVGKPVHHADSAAAEAAIAGFSVMNDMSVRDWQFRTVESTQDKIWDSSTPVGPWLVTPDEVGGPRPAIQSLSTRGDDVVTFEVDEGATIEAMTVGGTIEALGSGSKKTAIEGSTPDL